MNRFSLSNNLWEFYRKDRKIVLILIKMFSLKRAIAHATQDKAMNWKYFLSIGMLLTLGPISLFSNEENEETVTEEISKTGFDLTGDVRTELQLKNQKDSKKFESDLDVELNLQLEYNTDNTFSLIKFKFDNDMGVESGTFDKISLSKALFGLNLIEIDAHNVSMEVGRQPFKDIFHSKAQFNSSFDGLHVKYVASTPMGEAYIKQGGFVINDTNKKIGSATEIAIDDIAETGAYLKGSFTHWNPEHQVTQLSIGYKCLPEFLEQALHVYAAGLMNVKSKKNGYYVGFTLGETKKQGDYSLDINYQWLDKKAVHKKDAAGLGSNKKGFSGELCYNLTDKISLYKSFKWKRDIIKTEDSKNDWVSEIELRHSF